MEGVNYMAGMNGINGSNSVYTQASQLPGFGGLASGLDRDTLIEQMTTGTRAKIAKTNQKIDLVKWTQDAVRGITDKMYDFSNKYISFSSSSNLTSSVLFAKSQITPVGENSKYIGISGNATGKNMFSVLGVKQMAQDAKITSGNRVSDSAMITKPIDFAKGQEYSTIAGDSITFEMGNGDSKKTFKITIPTENADGVPFDLKSANGVADALNYAIEQYNEELSDNTKLTLEVSEKDGKLSFKNTGVNSIRIGSSTGNIQEELGIPNPDEGDDGKFKIEAETSVDGDVIEMSKLVDSKKMDELLKGAELTFDYNGKTEKITFKDEDFYVVEDGKVTSELKQNFKDDPAEAYRNLIQGKMDEAFGKGRIKVSLEGGDSDAKSLKLTTTTPDGNVDTSSVLTLKSGPSSLIGPDGALGISKGTSNRINMGATLAEAGLVGLDDQESYELEINGMSFTFDKDETISDVLKKINESEAGVTISYQSMSDKFVIESKEKGASGSINISGDLAKGLFGDSPKTQVGQDAIVTVKYDGQDEAIDIVRDSNGFTMEGLEVSIKGTFGNYVEEDGQMVIKEDPSTTVTFDANIDSQKTVDVVKSMVDDLNEIIDLVNKEMRTKPNRDYPPLTAEQRKEMSDDEIKKWEEKGKEGLLFNDSDLRGLSNALRFSIPTSLRADLEKIGISVSKEYTDNGKLVLDEEKLRTALEKDPQHVRELFNGDGTSKNKGLMGNLKISMDKYGATTGASKGILVNRAGSTHAPTSMLQNQMLSQINEYNRLIDSLNDRLKSEQDRYIKQFTSLETLISQMNSQSSYFMGMGGGY